MSSNANVERSDLGFVDLRPGVAIDTPTATETHISVVLFAGRRAYKFYKPVDLGFLDHSTLDRRRAAARRELDVNRRFAPDVYLGVAELVDESGEAHDVVLVMRWLPARNRLSSLLGEPSAAEHVRSVTRAVAAFHTVAPRSKTIDRAGTSAVLRTNWMDNFAVTEQAVPTLLSRQELDEARDRTDRYLAGREALFEERIADGCIVDGHGDLLTEDIFCLTDGPRILDALAFDDALRHGDVLLDVAFLAMDIERRAGWDMAQRCLAWYQEYAGERHPASLAHFYIAYRASVRAKVACLRWQQGDATAAERVVRDHAQCLDHLRRADVRLILVGGPPGTGKTTVAASLGAIRGWVVLSSDEIRKELHGLTHDADASAPVGEGLYNDDRVAEVYRELLRRAGALIALGETVVLDASWSAEGQRVAAREMASSRHAPIFEIRCWTTPEVADRRIVQRRAAGGSVSDADPDVARAMRERFAEWPGATVIDTTAAPEVVDQIIESVCV